MFFYLTTNFFIINKILKINTIFFSNEMHVGGGEKIYEVVKWFAPGDLITFNKSLNAVVVWDFRVQKCKTQLYDR